MKFLRFWLSLMAAMVLCLAYTGGLVLLGRWLHAWTGNVLVASGILIVLTSLVVTWVMTSSRVFLVIDRFLRRNRT
jgi:hypothetical protein